MNYKYVQNIESDTPIMCINKHIGTETREDGSVDEGVIGSVFQEELLSLANMGKKSVDVWINSTGGSIIDGFTIFSAILNSPIPVDTYNMGLCASTAGWIFQAGRNRVMSDFGINMMHMPFGGDSDKALNAMCNSIVTMLAAKSNLSENKIRSMMQDETWLNSKKTELAGLCDEIKITGKTPLESGLKSYKVAMNYFNSAIEQSKPIIKTSMNLKTICNRLSIDEVETEMALMDSIESIVNKAKRGKADAEKDLEDSKNEFKKKKEEMNAMEAMCKNLEEEVNSYKNAAIESEKKSTKAAAENMVNVHVLRGAISKESATKWVNKAVEDMEGVEEMLTEIAPQKSAPGNIDEVKTGQLNGIHVVSVHMAELQNKFNLNLK